MAKKLTSAGEGAKSIPNRDEEAVFLSHLNKLRIQQNKVAEVKAAFDAEKAVMTDLFRVAKTDGFTRKELQAILDDGASSRRDLTSEEQRRTQLRLWAGLPAGSQADLFDLPSPARDEVDAEGTGYTMGLRGEDPVMPDAFSPNYLQAFMKGWEAGQEKLVKALTPTPANDLADAEVKGAA